MTEKELAQNNFDWLRQNPYPGRGLIIGKSLTDEWLILYWIMGRSQQSRNRRFAAEGATLRTEPVDASLVKDASLIIYEAMLDLPGVYIASNGDQTRTIYEALRVGGSFDGALSTREREPDAPNFTPRISGIVDCTRQPGGFALSILKANPLNPQETDRYTYRPALPVPGYGFGLTTYAGDGDPLPSFCGDPLLLPLPGSPESLLETYWNALNVENRVALALKVIPAAGNIRLLVQNRF
ncbi:MAG: IMP cyclohydrolase [Chloroflexota bacterium]